MAMCDAKYVFTYLEVGSQGREGNSGVFSRSGLAQGLRTNAINIPDVTPVPGTHVSLPYVIVGDEAFPLRNNLMWPYPGRTRCILPYKEQVYNYRLSRARRIIENTFGILAARWRLFLRPVNATIENVEVYIKAAVALHNYLWIVDEPAYVTPGLVDQEVGDGTFRLGRWRDDVERAQGLSSAPRFGSNMASENARSIQLKFADFFISPAGAIPWQGNFTYANE